MGDEPARLVLVARGGELAVALVATVAVVLAALARIPPAPRLARSAVLVGGALAVLGVLAALAAFGETLHALYLSPGAVDLGNAPVRRGVAAIVARCVGEVSLVAGCVVAARALVARRRSRE